MQLLLRWVSYLKKDLGEQFHLIEDKEFIFLSTMGEKTLRLLSAFAHKAKRFISTNVVTGFDDGAPILVLVFEDHELYSNYIAPIYEMGGAEVLPSNGVYLSTYTYPHIVLLADSDLSACETTLTHELTHFYLSTYKIPRWLDEGLAKLIEQEVTGTASFRVTKEGFATLVEFWTSADLGIFWSGEIFERGDGSENFGYELAEIVVRNLAAQGKDKLQEFIREAKRADGGAKAANLIFDVDLTDLVEDILSQS